MPRGKAPGASRAHRPARRVARQLQSLSDEELLARSRNSDEDAYAELWRRHSKAAFVAANSFSGLIDPDDAVAEAFTKIYETLVADSGAGPTTAFRPYLYVTIRNLAQRQLRGTRSENVADLEAVPTPFADPAEEALEKGLTATAFRSLPQRWQTVLWYTEVERLSHKQAGNLMDLAPNAVAALSFRARQGLREAWVQGHVTDTSVSGSHREVLSKLGAWSLGTLGQRDERMVEEHLRTCIRCRLIAEELDDVAKSLALILLPLVLGGSAALLFRRQLDQGASTASPSTFPAAARLAARPRRAVLVGAGAVVLVAAAVAVALSATPPANHPPLSASVPRPAVSLTPSLPSASSVPAPAPVPTTVPVPARTIPPASPVAEPSPPVAPPLGVPPVHATSPHAPKPPTQSTGSATTTTSRLAPPVVTSPTTVLTRLATSTITGTAPVGASVEAFRDGEAVHAAEVTAAGTWTFDATDLGEGATTLQFSSARAGFARSATVSVRILRDDTPPAAPVITSTWSNSQTTPLQLSGTAEPDSTVTIATSSGVVLVTVPTDSKGTWTLGTIPGISPTLASLEVTATDQAGNTSRATVAGPFAFVPVISETSGATYPSGTVPVDLTGWPGSTVTLTLNGASQGSFTFASTGSLHLTAQGTRGAALPAGDYTVDAEYEDASGTSTGITTTTFTVAP